MPISIQELKKLKPVTREDDEKLKKEAKKEYMKEYNVQYNVEHKERKKKYYEENKEKVDDYSKQYMKEYNVQYYEGNKEERKRYASQYYIDNKEKLDEQHKQYLKDNPDKVSEISKRRNARRRKLKFEPINEYFPGGVWHHINENDVMCIPEELHRSVYHNSNTGQGMQEINDLAQEFLLSEMGEC